MPWIQIKALKKNQWHLNFWKKRTRSSLLWRGPRTLMILIQKTYFVPQRVNHFRFHLEIVSQSRESRMKNWSTLKIMMSTFFMRALESRQNDSSRQKRRIFLFVMSLIFFTRDLLLGNSLGKNSENLEFPKMLQNVWRMTK